MADSGTYTPETIARRMEIARSLLGDRKKPITHWAEGLDELAKGYFGGKMFSDAERAEKASNAAQSEALKSLLGGGATETVPVAPSPTGAVNVPEEYRPMIAQASKEYGIPEDLLSRQLKQESGFRPQVVSKAGAQGLAQFMPDTAKEMGVNPLDPASAIPGAAKYLAQNRDRYGGDMTKALAAYNWGPGNVDKWSASGADPSRLPAETRGYIANILGSTPSSSGPQVAQAGGDTRAAVVKMLSSPNPAVQKMGRSLASGIVQKQLEGEKPTDDMREYQTAIKQGFKGTLLDYQTKLKEAGKPVTNINQQQESEYQKTTGKQYAEMNNDIIKSAQSARGKIATLDRLGGLLSDPNIMTGAGAGTILEAKRIAKTLGFDVGDLGPAEAVRAISNQFALELRNPSGGAGMPGALSDKDREFLQASVPGLQQNPEGNKLIIDYMKRVANRSLEVDKLRRAYVKENGRVDDGFFDVLSEYSEKNPLFSEKDMMPAAKPANDGWTTLDNGVRIREKK